MWFRHPKPFIQKAVAMQMVKRDAEPAPATSITVDNTTPAAADLTATHPGIATRTDPIEFTVTYTLRDYLV